MTSTPPEGGTPATPLYDQTISVPEFGELREPPLTLEEGSYAVGDASSGSATDEAKDRAQQTKGAAKDAASDVKDAAKDAGARVASTSKDQASRVVKDAMGQARDLYGQATDQLSEQAGTQQQKAAGTLHTFADDLGEMGGRGGSGLASELVQNLERRARDLGDWLEQRDPEDVLDEVKQFAARRPGVFIGLAAVTGIVAARLTKALVAEARDESEPDLDGPSVGDFR